ncbi:cell division control protein 42 homolog [Limulus polyphemus]|uniref:Cell division control protein 42 homolog n=1 Tax=Limulus polyphemus TaxID=6850 RepID=A0ABM1BQF0_LIMPO|nr:cell division control protein 42 homolog [Limulus polyphemus]
MPPLARDQGTSLLSDHDSAGDCMSQVKCVLIGDGAVGKTSLVVSYTLNSYTSEYVPTAFDNYSAVVTVDNLPVRLQLCDTAGQDDFNSLRPLCYPHTQVFLLCFSVMRPTSFFNLRDRWLPEIRHFSPQATVILVGTQCDLRFNVKTLLELAQYGEQPVPVHEARQLAQRTGALAYLECSALTKENVKEVFDTAILAGLRNNRQDIVHCPRAKSMKTWQTPEKGSPLKIAIVSSSSYRKSNKKWWNKLCCFASSE